MKNDNLSLVLNELSENKLLGLSGKVLSRKDVSSKRYSEIQKIYNLNCDTPVNEFFRRKGKLNNLFNFRAPEGLLTKIKFLFKK